MKQSTALQFICTPLPALPCQYLKTHYYWQVLFNVSLFISCFLISQFFHLLTIVPSLGNCKSTGGFNKQFCCKSLVIWGSMCVDSHTLCLLHSATQTRLATQIWHNSLKYGADTSWINRGRDRGDTSLLMWILQLSQSSPKKSRGIILLSNGKLLLSVFHSSRIPHLTVLMSLRFESVHGVLLWTAVNIISCNLYVPAISVCSSEIDNNSTFPIMYQKESFA